MRPWILAETNYHHVKDCEYEVAVLPMGATEPHNLHLPYGTDTLQADAIGSRVCKAAWNAGAKVVMLPPIPYGTETNQAKCRLSIIVILIPCLVASIGMSTDDPIYPRIGTAIRTGGCMLVTSVLVYSLAFHTLTRGRYITI